MCMNVCMYVCMYVSIVIQGLLNRALIERSCVDRCIKGGCSMDVGMYKIDRYF